MRPEYLNTYKYDSFFICNLSEYSQPNVSRLAFHSFFMKFLRDCVYYFRRSSVQKSLYCSHVLGLV